MPLSPSAFQGKQFRTAQLLQTEKVGLPAIPEIPILAISVDRFPDMR
jgi:hypothetical protein